MAKSEYYQPRTVEGEKEQPQLLVDAMEIYSLLLRAEMMMTKVDRIRYATRAIEQIQDVIKEFYLAYDFEEDRLAHLKRLCANVGLFLITMRIIAERNCISCVPASRFGGMTPDGVKRGLMDEVSPEWWRYCLYDDERRCLVAGGCYKHNEILKRKYHFRFNKDKRRRHDRTGETGQDQRPGVGAA